VEPRAPLWIYVAAAQLVDIGWAGLVMFGVERMRVDPSLPGSPLVLEHMPYTHSLPAAVLWSLGAAGLVRLAMRLPWRAAAVVGLTVFSHWIGDLVVHRPDLELWFGGTKAGFGLWNHPVREQAVEMGLVAVAATAWGWRLGTERRRVGSGLLFLAALVALQILAMVVRGGLDPVETVRRALFIYLAVTLAAWLAEWPGRRSSAPEARPAA
jgi:hypothetical protein